MSKKGRPRVEREPSEKGFKRMEKYFPDIKRYCIKCCQDTHLDYKDVFQEALLTYWRFSESSENKENIKGWMVEVFKNTFRNELRKKHTQMCDIPDGMETKLGVFNEIENSEMQSSEFIFSFSDNLVEMLSLINKRDREFMLMSYVHGYSMRDISETYGVTESLVNSRIYIAKNKMKDHMKTNQEKAADLSKKVNDSIYHKKRLDTETLQDINVLLLKVASGQGCN